jgi:hypothetical protein
VRVEENPPTFRMPSPDDLGTRAISPSAVITVGGAVHMSSLQVGVKRRNEDGFGTARGVEIRFNNATVHQCGDDRPESSRRLVLEPESVGAARGVRPRRSSI